MMSEAYFIAASSGPIQLIAGKSREDQVSPILDGLFRKSAVPSRRIQEIHWIGGGEVFWLDSIERQNRQMACFLWPSSSPLLAHFMLQACARSIEVGERDVILLAQETEGQAVVLMLASPAAVGRYNLSPWARIGPRLALSTAEEDLFSIAQEALAKAELDPASVTWLSSICQFEGQSAGSCFPAARWISAGDKIPSGDLFLLAALSERLEKEKLVMLLSKAPQQSALVTVMERV